MPGPTVQAPLVAGATVVRVTGIISGATVEIFSTSLVAGSTPQLIGLKTVYAQLADIPVAPQLVEGSVVSARQIGCGQTSRFSRGVTVQAAPQALAAPNVYPPSICARSILVGNITPGAIVDVFTRKVWLGSTMAAAAIVQVALQGQTALNPGEQITATQRLGGVISPRSAAAKVVNGVCSYVTQRFDIGRTGWNQYESLLTVNSVLSGFAAIATLTVQGEVAAQPLYLRGLTIGGKQRNIVFVATSENYIYAFDADTFEQIWRQN